MGSKPFHLNNAPTRAGEAGPLDTAVVIRLVVASIIFAFSLILKLLPSYVSLLLLIVSAAAAGYDIVMEAVNSVEAGEYFATPLIIVVVTVLSFVIGFGAEGAALVILYQIGNLLIAYTKDKTKKSALELLHYQDSETAERVASTIEQEEALELPLKGMMEHSSGKVLKYAIIFAVVYAIVLPLVTNFSFAVSIHRALMIIIVCTPMSVIAAMPVTAMVGLCRAGQLGAVFSSAATMETAADTTTVLIDKAGIFTADAPKLVGVQSDVLDSKTLMNFAAHALYYSEQPIAKAIAAANDTEYRLEVISDFMDIPGCGVDLKVAGSPVTLGTRALFVSRGVDVPYDMADDNKLVYYMTVADKYVGKLVFSDELNPDTLDIADGIRATGIAKCILLTDDGKDEAEELADRLGFDEFISECDTAKKLRIIKNFSEAEQQKTMYIYAAGIEAHSAAETDIRVSRKGKYADAIVAPEYAANLPQALYSCFRMREVATENALFAFIIKAILIFLSINGYCNLWFAMFIDMVAVLATILNSIRVTTNSLIKPFNK